MITRFDKLQLDLTRPNVPSPNSAAAVQELLGGKFGEMSTFRNYTFQSFNFRGRSRMPPFYDLVANIATDEFSHIELPLHRERPAGAADGLGELLDRTERVLERQPQARPAAQLLPRVRRTGEQDPRLRDGRGPHGPRDGGLPAGARWRAHRRLREGARETDRRGRRQAPADPDISNKRFPESRKHEERGLHQILYRFNPDDYAQVGAIWNGTRPEDGSELRVEDTSHEGATPPDLDEEPQLTAPLGPDIDADMFKSVATKLFGNGLMSRSGKGNGKAAKKGVKARR
jgi:Mn-containing catalase